MKNAPVSRLHRIRLLRSYLRGDTHCPALPLTAVVAGSSRCNLSCRMCLRAVREFPAEHPDFGVLQRLVDEGAGPLRYVCLDGPGEPLLNPDIFRMVRLCRERGIRTIFSTNATLLDGAMADTILDSGLDQIIFAVNGTTPDVFEYYHRGASHAEVCGNIHRFLARKRERRSPIQVSLQMIRLPLTEPQIPEFFRQWRIPGVDFVRVKTDVVCLEGVCLESRRRRTPPRQPCPRARPGRGRPARRIRRRSPR